MKEKFCQSCGMPMADDAMHGTNQDGSLNEDYCNYCYENGDFTSDISMEEMIAFCVPHMASANPDMTEQQASEAMKAFFPKLKRWQ